MSKERSLISNPFEGVKCPQCGSIDLNVVSTRRAENALRRRRECNRGHRFDTVELLADDAKRSALLIHELLDARNLAQALDRTLAETLKKLKGEE